MMTISFVTRSQSDRPALRVVWPDDDEPEPRSWGKAHPTHLHRSGEYTAAPAPQAELSVSAQYWCAAHRLGLVEAYRGA